MTVAGGGGGGECSDGSRWRATTSNCACFSREFLAKNFPFITPLTTYNSLSTKNNSFDHGGRRRPYALRRTDTRANFDGQSFPMFDGQSFRNCSQLIVSFFEFERIYSNSDERGGQTAYQTLQSWLYVSVPNPHICHDRDGR